MKTKTENRKFTLEKFEVAKLINLRNIIGGTGTIGVTDDPGGTDDQSPLSTKFCNESRNSKPPCPQRTIDTSF